MSSSLQAVQRQPSHVETHCRLADTYMVAWVNPAGEMSKRKGEALIRLVRDKLSSVVDGGINEQLMHAAEMHYQICVVGVNKHLLQGTVRAEMAHANAALDMLHAIGIKGEPSFTIV